MTNRPRCLSIVRTWSMASLVLVSNIALFGVHAPPCWGQEAGIYFDEAGTIDEAPMVVGAEMSVYVVAFGIVEVQGYAFEMIPTVAPNFFLEKSLYGTAPSDSGVEYEIVAELEACTTDPAAMGTSGDSWTLARYGVLYFAPANDVYYCLHPAPSTGAAMPQFTLCDPDRTQLDLDPATVDPAGIAPDGCAVANPTGDFCKRCSIPTDTPSWGTLKSQYR